METRSLEHIRLLLLDVDGVLTDGRIIYGDDGREIKAFHVKDGLGIRLLREAGIKVGIITGRRSQALRHRCHDLGITLLYDGATDKAALLPQVLAEAAVTRAQVAWMGDDLPDITLFGRVGLSIAVADAHPIVRQRADMVTRATGGNGAVREICEAILVAQNRWDDLWVRFLNPDTPRTE